MGYIFGGNTGLTYDQLQQRRSQAQQMRQRGATTTSHRNVAHGLNSAANSVLGALLQRKYDKQHKVESDKATDVFNQLVQNDRGASFGDLLGASSNEYLNRGQQNALSMLLQKKMSEQAEMRAAKRAAAARSASSAAAAAKPPKVVDINGQAAIWNSEAGSYQPVDGFAPEREILKDRNDVPRFKDTGEPVYPNVTDSASSAAAAAKPPKVVDINGQAAIWNSEAGSYQPVDGFAPEREILKDRNDVPRFKDTGEPVYPNVTDVEEDPFDQESKLRKEFRGGTVPKDFGKVRDSFDRITATSGSPSPAGDLALIFNYMKLLDPGSVVREGEFATAQNAAGVDERIRGQFNRILSGERLTGTQRKDFIQKAGELFNAQAKNYNNEVNYYRGLAEEYDVNQDRIAKQAELYKSPPTDTDSELSDGVDPELLKYMTPEERALLK